MSSAFKGGLHRFVPLLVIVFSSFFFQQNAEAQVTNKRQMAVEGDSVWVIINHVKPGKREQFEKFLHEIFWPMASKLTVEEQQLFKQTRILHPTGPEEDGTYSYVFIMDPLVTGGNYGITSLLRKQYGEEQGAAYAKMFDDAQARPQKIYSLVQSKH